MYFEKVFQNLKSRIKLKFNFYDLFRAKLCLNKSKIKKHLLFKKGLEKIKYELDVTNIIKKLRAFDIIASSKFSSS